MSISEFESRLQEQIKSLVAAHLSNFEHEIGSLQQAVEQTVKNSFTRALETATQGLSGLAQDNGISALVNELSGAFEAQVAAAAAAQAKSSTNLSMLKVSINEIQTHKTQADVLSALVSQASSFSPRVALFIVKSGNAVGWMARGFENDQGNEAIRGLAISLQSDTILRTVLSKQVPFAGEPQAQPENSLLFDRFGSGTPARIAGIPLLVRGKAAAVLYADSGSLLGESINLEALEILVNIAGITIELISIRPRTNDIREGVQAAAQTVESIAKTAAPLPTPTPISTPVPAPVPAPIPAPIPTPIPAPMPRTLSTEPTPVSVIPAAVSPSAPPAPKPETPIAPVARPAPAKPVSEPLPAAVESVPVTASYPNLITADARAGMAAPPPPPPPAITDTNPSPISFKVEAVNTEPTPAPQDFFVTTNPPPAVSFSDTGKTPAPPTWQMPVDTPSLNEEEKKLHNDARRFARLLVSEIKLYNEQKVIDGRKNHDLYDRLKEDIDRSRQMYDKRVSALVAAKFDYFYDELVNTLAEGDAVKLGRDCPGPSVQVS
ncbi:MAG: hypothetical protein AB1489_09170 [Acidobacteriota bacterium]